MRSKIFANMRITTRKKKHFLFVFALSLKGEEDLVKPEKAWVQPTTVLGKHDTFPP